MLLIGVTFQKEFKHLWAIQGFNLHYFNLCWENCVHQNKVLFVDLLSFLNCQHPTLWPMKFALYKHCWRTVFKTSINYVRCFFVFSDPSPKDPLCRERKISFNTSDPPPSSMTVRFPGKFFRFNLTKLVKNAENSKILFSVWN